MGTTFPIGWDQGHAIAQRWNVSTMPSSFILDDKGTVRFVHAGYHDGDETQIEKEVTELIGGASDAKTGDTKPADDKPAATDPPPADDKPAAADPPPDTKPAKPTKKKGSKKKKPKKTQKTTTSS
jgi:hypothetical protein